MYATLARHRAGLKCRIVVTWHSTKLLHLKEFLQMLAYRPLFWLADCTVFLCRRQMQHWRWRGLLSRRNTVIYNGIDAEAVPRSQPASRSARNCAGSWAGGPADYVIGIPALLRVEKNHLQLLEAVARLRRQGIPARALLIGDGEQRGAIEQRMPRAGPAERGAHHRPAAGCASVARRLRCRYAVQRDRNLLAGGAGGHGHGQAGGAVRGGRCRRDGGAGLERPAVSGRAIPMPSWTGSPRSATRMRRAAWASNARRLVELRFARHNHGRSLRGTAGRTVPQRPRRCRRRVFMSLTDQCRHHRCRCGANPQCPPVLQLPEID